MAEPTHHIAFLAVTGFLAVEIHIGTGLGAGKGCRSVSGESWGEWTDRQVEERKVRRLVLPQMRTKEQRRIAVAVVVGIARPQV